MAKPNPYVIYSGGPGLPELATVLVEHFAPGKDQGRINAIDYKEAVHGAILAGPAREHEAQFLAYDAEQYAAQHPREFKESRGTYAIANDLIRIVR